MKYEPIAILERFGPPVEAELSDVLGDSKLPFYEMMRYHLGWIESDGRQTKAGGGGKLLRPALCLLSYEAFGHNFSNALPAAAALELVHNFSLIHDDIEDRSLERRHRPTVWSVWGEPQAINTGDGMHVLARLASTKIKKTFPPARVLGVVEALDEACLSLCEGQYLDISFEGRVSVSIDEYMSMIERKTAALLSCSCRIGALLGSDNAKMVAYFAGFGKKLGLAFQIKDDFLGIWGNQAKTGKSNEGDIEQRKKTLPVIYAFENSDWKTRDILVELYRKQSLNDDDKATILNIIEQTGARSYTEKVAAKLFSEAIEELKRTQLNHPSVDSLECLARFIVDRDF